VNALYITSKKNRSFKTLFSLVGYTTYPLFSISQL
jgi:hypothetical protein